MPKWTAAQQAAIDYSGRNLLLSAAAGSGKTATLTQRIVTLLTDPASEAEISRMLCVTFTRAAAAELRARIGSALREALHSDPKNARLTRQICDLGRAQITTIHSFCLHILRPHAAELSLPAGFSVAQPSDTAALSKQVMADVLSECFDGGDEDFFRLADTLGGARDESSLDDVMLSLANTLTAHGLSDTSLAALAGEMARTEQFFASPMGAGTRAQTRRFAAHFADYFAKMAEDFAEDELFARAYLPAARTCAEVAQRITAACDAGDYTAVRETLLAFSPPARLGMVKKELQTEDVLYFKDQYADFKKQISTLLARSFALTEEETLLAAARTADINRTAANILHRYFAELRQRKNERGLVDFGDLESMAASLLTDEHGAPTELAREAGAAYDYIFIDEYQDTNRTQDAIFSALSAGGGARFMVGDIKQSIYRFRGAEPEVFAGYRRLWPSVQEHAAGAPGESIFMRENFRCDKTVVDFVNLVSRHLFASGAIPFTADDELAFAKAVPEGYVPAPAEICLLDSADGDAPTLEAEYTADRIAQMIGRVRRADGVPLAPSDIAILLRSPGADGAAFVQALARKGIPVQNQAAISLYEEPEVVLMLSILRAMDNPARDIDLAGAMKSPVFGFSLDDLIQIRRALPEGSLWAAVRAAAEGEDELAARCRDFAARLTALRADARGMAADKLILRLYEETDIARLAKQDPEREATMVRANLRALYETARQLENSTAGGGLYAFLRSIAEAIEEGESTAAAGEQADAVRLFSIHQSKGLEFPVCFLCRTAKRRNNRDSTAAMLFDPSIGAVMRLPDESGIVLCDTPQRRSAAALIDDASIEEEMRVLYVAMTRARERLIVTAALRDPEKILEQSELSAAHHSAHTVYSASGYIFWILDALAAARHKLADTSCADVRVIHRTVEEAEPHWCEPAATAQSEHPPLDEAEIERLTALFGERFAYVYPHAHLAEIPAKLTVSRLTPSILDENEERERTEMSRTPHLEPDNDPERNRAPRFLSGKTEFEASFSGTATHVFMQFCDFARLRDTSAQTELERLLASGFLTPTMAEAVRLSEIEKFRRSALLTRICRAPIVRREFRFNAALPACDFTKNPSLAEKLRADGTNVIVQGVVDCLIVEEDGHAVLLDYKTDRLTREELGDPALAAQKLLARHASQLQYYRAVCAAMLGRHVDECLIYSLPLGDTIAVPTENEE